MTSAAQQKSNAENAKKSTGPRSVEGKERARRNALTHGMTAQVVLLPDENRAEYQQWMGGLVAELRPRTAIECILAERVAYSLVRSERATRAQTARLCFKAHTRAQDQARRTGQDVIELTQTLFRPPLGRPAAHPFAEQRGDSPNALSAGVLFERGDHPALVVGRLEASAPGCLWVRARWNELGALLEDGLNWRAPERFRAFRLLGIHPSDALFTSELTSLLHACEVLDPSAGSIVSEIWNEVVSAEALPSLVETYERESRRSRAWDEATARRYLLGVVQLAIERLDAKEKYHAYRTQIEIDLAQHLSAFDDSREGALMRRYEEACDRALHKNLNELRARQAAKPDGNAYVAGGYFVRPSPSWVSGFDIDSETNDQDGMSDGALYGDLDGECEMTDPDELNEVAGMAVSLPNEPSYANWVEEAAEIEMESAMRNEPSEADSEDEAAESGLGSAVRNEPSEPDGPAFAADCGRPIAQRNEPSSAAAANAQPEGITHIMSEKVAATRVEAMGNAEEQPRRAAVGGIRRDAAHPNVLAGARRERRKRKREERRARARTR
jgi:hypothetical protein